jgi:hypothetical protein
VLQDNARTFTLSDGTTLHAGGQSHVLGFIGHNGLMDAPVDLSEMARMQQRRKGVFVLACASKAYFYESLDNEDTFILGMTTGLMCPEAYSTHGLLEGILAGEGYVAVRDSIAAQYATYQQCSVRAARRLFMNEGTVRPDIILRGN